MAELVNICNLPEFQEAVASVQGAVDKKAEEHYHKVYKFDKDIKYGADMCCFSADEIAKEAGCTTETVARSLRRQKLSLTKPTKRKVEIPNQNDYYEAVRRLKQFKGLSQTAAECGLSMYRVRMIARAERLPDDFFELPFRERAAAICHRYNVTPLKKAERKPSWNGYVPQKYDVLVDKFCKEYIVVETDENGFRVKPKHNPPCCKVESEHVSLKMWQSGKCKFKMCERFDGTVKKENQNENTKNQRQSRIY